jgi:hypothetical protein
MKTREEVAEFLKEFMRRGMELEGLIELGGKKIREQSKIAYGSELLDARLLAMSSLAFLLRFREGQPGATNESRSHRLVLVTSFVQGAPATETLISEGQYAKAAAALKQDYEILARMAEIRAGKAKQGQTPNVKHAPDGSQFIYGDLNKVAHPSNEPILDELLNKLVAGEIRGVSPLPVLQKDVARQLYEVHVFTLLHVVREGAKLMTELYPGCELDLEPMMQSWVTALSFLERVGWTVEEKA